MGGVSSSNPRNPVLERGRQNKPFNSRRTRRWMTNKSASTNSWISPSKSTQSAESGNHQRKLTQASPKSGKKQVGIGKSPAEVDAGLAKIREEAGRGWKGKLTEALKHQLAFQKKVLRRAAV